MPVIRKLFSSASVLRVFLDMEEIYARMFGRRIAELRESGLSGTAALARVAELEHRLSLLQRWLELLIARHERIKEAHRYQWSPEARYQILELRRAEHLTANEAGRRAGMSTSAIHRWESASRQDPEKKTVGSLLKPIPPLRRIADAIRRMTVELQAAGITGARTIALTLARVGIRVSATSARRFRREPENGPDPARTPRLSGNTSDVERPLRPRHPKHVYNVDLTPIPSWLGLFEFKLAVVMDSYSRFPLAFRVFAKEPSAGEIRLLLRKAFGKYGAPEIFVTDHGPQFISKKVRKFLKRHGVEPRLGAVGKSGSIARIERLWRTVKSLLPLRLLPPLIVGDLARQVEVALRFYAYHRPHQGLRGATPEEVFFGLRPACEDAVPAPRGRPGDPSPPIPIEVRYLDPERRFPVLLRVAA